MGRVPWTGLSLSLSRQPSCFKDVFGPLASKGGSSRETLTAVSCPNFSEVSKYNDPCQWTLSLNASIAFLPATTAAELAPGREGGARSAWKVCGGLLGAEVQRGHTCPHGSSRPSEAELTPTHRLLLIKMPLKSRWTPQSLSEEDF